MEMGGLSAGWYSIWTGLVLLYVAYLLGTVSNTDPLAAYAAVVAAGLGIWQLASGIRNGPGRPTSSDDD